MTDAALVADSNLYQQLVPFDPEFITSGIDRSEGRKPSNWVTESDSQQARERLHAGRV